MFSLSTLCLQSAAVVDRAHLLLSTPTLVRVTDVTLRSDPDSYKCFRFMATDLQRLLLLLELGLSSSVRHTSFVCRVSVLFTGVSMVTDDYVISASIDQTVVVWSVTITDDYVQVSHCPSSSSSSNSDSG